MKKGGKPSTPNLTPTEIKKLLKTENKKQEQAALGSSDYIETIATLKTESKIYKWLMGGLAALCFTAYIRLDDKIDRTINEQVSGRNLAISEAEKRWDGRFDNLQGRMDNNLRPQIGTNASELPNDTSGASKMNSVIPSTEPSAGQKKP